MIKIENGDELQELISQENKEFIRLYNPSIFIHKKLYNLLLKVKYPVTFKVYSVYTDRYQLILVSILEFISFSLDNFNIEIYIDEDIENSGVNTALYWIEKERNFPLLQLETIEANLDYDTYVENIQLELYEAIKENIGI